MEIGNIIPHIEALIFASEKPLTAMELTELLNNAFGFMDEKLTLEQVQTAIDGIVEKYRSEFYPFEIRESGGGLQFLTKKDYHKTVAQPNGDKFPKRLSTAALETLSIIAYKQPVTKGDIEAIRGVSSDYAIQRLLEKELIVILGRNEKMPGHPLVYGTSKNFMDYFGINSAEDLPKLKEIFDENIVAPTTISEAEAGNDAVAEEDTVLVVSENGELVQSNTDIPTAVEHTEENVTEEEAADQEVLSASDDESVAAANESDLSTEEATASDVIDEDVPEEEEIDELGEDEADELSEEEEEEEEEAEEEEEEEEEDDDDEEEEEDADDAETAEDASPDEEDPSLPDDGEEKK